MNLFFAKKLVMAKIETVYATDSVPAAIDAILAGNMKITPLVMSQASRSYVRPSGSGSYEKIMTGSQVKLDFEVELAGSGVAGTAPKWGNLARACGWSETLTALTSAIYKPVSTVFDSITLAFNIDGQLHKLVGARGDMDINIKAMAIPMLKFSFTGLWVDPSSSPMPASPDFTAFIEPLVIDKINTTTASLHALPVLLESLDIKGGVKVQYRQLVGYEGIDIIGRDITGSVSFEAPDIATKDWFTAARSGAKGALSIIHGTTAGNIIELAAPTVQLDAPNYNDLNGIASLQAGITLIPSDTPGNDELVLTVR